VNAFIEEHQDRLPLEFTLLHYKPCHGSLRTPWRFSGYMYRTLTDTRERELNRAKVTERAGADRAKDLFSEESAMDHFVVGDPSVPNDGSQRSAADNDDEDDDDIQPDTVLKARRAGVNGLPHQMARRT